MDAPRRQPRPISRQIDVRHAEHRGGGYTLRIFGKSRVRWIWISPPELPEVVIKLIGALPPDQARDLLRGSCARLMSESRQP